MKHLIHKICITSGLLVTGLGFAQTAEEEMQLLHDTPQSSDNWRVQSKGIKDDGQSATKTYGEDNGLYYLYLPASGASPVSKSVTSLYGLGGCIYRNSATAGTFDIQLQIPDGHEIRGFRYFWEDNSASDTTAYLYTVDRSGTFSNELSVTSTGSSGFGSSYSSFAPFLVVDNYNYSYTMRFYSNESGGDQEMCGVRIAIDSTP